MFFILWLVVAFGLVLGVVLLAARQTRAVVPPLVLPPGETLPLAPLQRVVRWSLLVAIPLMAAAGALIGWHEQRPFDK